MPEGRKESGDDRKYMFYCGGRGSLMVEIDEVTVLIQEGATRSQNRGVHPGLATRTRSSDPARTTSDEHLPNRRFDALCFDALYNLCFQRWCSGTAHMSPRSLSMGMHREGQTYTAA